MTQLATTTYSNTPTLVPGTARRESGLSRFGFFLFMLINATLFVRPADMFVSLNEWPIYERLCVLCMVVSLPQLMEEFAPRTLKRWPYSACIVGLLLAVALSQLSHFQVGEALACCIEFLKLLAYFMLLMVHVNSVTRLKQFMLGIALFTMGMTLLSLLQYHGYLNMPQLAAYYEQQDDVDDETGELVVLGRLRSLGIFNNPNDLARILVAAIIVCFAFLGDRKQGMARFGWLAPIAVLGYATALTYSRGGFLGLLGGLLILFYLRFGRIKTILVAAVVLPMLLIVYAGRQTNFSVEEGTGHQRILFWRDGFAELVRVPIFGTGMNTYDKIAGAVAHNSFVHAFVELGIFGGTLFVGLFYFGTVTLYHTRRYDAHVGDRELLRLRPYIIALVASYAIGMLSSARVYTETTYVLTGMAAAYYRLLGRRLGEVLPSFTAATMRRLVVAGMLVLVGHYVFVRLNA